MTDDTKKVPERKLRHSRPHHAGAGSSPLPTARKPIAADTTIDNTAWRIKRPPDQPLAAQGRGYLAPAVVADVAVGCVSRRRATAPARNAGADPRAPR